MLGALSGALRRLSVSAPPLATASLLAQPTASTALSQVRWGHRFMKAYKGKSLWASSTGSSNAGRKRGRRRPRPYDLNRGQRTGEGLAYNVHFPGFSAEPYSELRRSAGPRHFGAGALPTAPEASTVPSFAPMDGNRWDSIVEIRRQFKRTRRQTKKQTPFERGYTGDKLPGKKISELLPEEMRQLGFQAVILEQKMISTGTTRGHLRRISTLVAVGNGEGVVATCVGKGLMGKSSIQAALTKATRRLEFMERLEERTVYQDFYAEAAGVRIFVQREGDGAGIAAHRVIRDLCHLVGLRDVSVRLWGSASPQMLAKAFLTGLRHQETFQQLAERKGLHVVEMSKNQGFMPKVVASPRDGNVRQEVPADEPLDLDDVYGGGRVPYDKEPAKPFFHNFATFIHARWLEWPFRNHEELKVRLVADGLVRSWNWRERHEWAARKQRAVVEGDAVLPQGLGLQPCTRKSLQGDE